MKLWSTTKNENNDFFRYQPETYWESLNVKFIMCFYCISIKVPEMKQILSECDQTVN